MRIKELRIENKYTQLELANKVGCNQTAIGKYERGDLEPNLEVLIKLSRIFNCSIDYLVGNSDDFDNIVATQSNLTERESRLLKAFGTLSALEQDKLIADAEFYSMRNRSKFEPIKK